LLLGLLQEALAQQASTRALRTTVLCEDSYYYSQAHLSLEERAALNFDHPDALDHTLLATHLAALKAGKAIDVPVYDYASHTRACESRRLLTADIVLLDGCLILSQSQIRSQLDLSFFLAADLEVCLARRILRDTMERGRSEASVREQFESTVRPMYHAFLEPSSHYADIALSGEVPPQTSVDTALAAISSLVTTTAASAS
jgi:uridine kinase